MPRYARYFGVECIVPTSRVASVIRCIARRNRGHIEVRALTPFPGIFRKYLILNMLAAKYLLHLALAISCSFETVSVRLDRLPPRPQDRGLRFRPSSEESVKPLR